MNQTINIRIVADSFSVSQIIISWFQLKTNHQRALVSIMDGQYELQLLVLLMCEVKCFATGGR